VQTLTVNRADVNIRNDDGLTPLEMLNQDEKVNEIIKQYIENDKSKKPIEEEDKSNIKNEDEMNNEIIKQYIGNDKLKKPNAQDKNGETALHKAIYESFKIRKKIVETLTADRADVNITKINGHTPLEKVNEIIKQYIENDKLKKPTEEDKSNIQNEDEMNNKIIKQYIGNYIKLKKTIEEEDKSSIRELLKPKSQICLIL
jgi:ankyrin repeat protein